MGKNDDYFVKRPSAPADTPKGDIPGRRAVRRVEKKGSGGQTYSKDARMESMADKSRDARDEERLVRRGAQSGADKTRNSDIGGSAGRIPEAHKEGKRADTAAGGAITADKPKRRGILARIENAYECTRLPRDYSAGSVDMVFLLILAIIIAFGTVMVFSSSHAYAVREHGDGYHYLRNQLIVVALGCVLVAIVALFPLKSYSWVTWAVYFTAVALLIAVLVIGVSEGEAKRWILLPGGMSFQPSELGKTAVVMMLALFMSKYQEKVESKKLGESFKYGILMPILIFGVIAGLVILENHFSGVLIICGIAACMMIFGGTRLLYILSFGAVGLSGIFVLIFMTPYAANRIKIWFDPWSDLMGKGWQTVQGLYSIASGGIFGVGLGNSHQKYGYVSEPQNDFVFTIACEELGFVGAVAIIALFGLLIWRGFSIARHSPNRFTYLLVLGLISKIAIQVILNIAVVTNSIPNTGIPLPFFSSGGSSLLVLMAEMGIILSVSRYSKQKK